MHAICTSSAASGFQIVYFHFHFLFQSELQSKLYELSVFQDGRVGVLSTAAILAHEMGHNFGMEHDSVDCLCAKNIDCLMAPALGLVVRFILMFYSVVVFLFNIFIFCKLLNLHELLALVFFRVFISCT